MILEGVTDQGAVVPVQVTAQGKLVAEGLAGPAGPAGPEGPAGPAGADGQWNRTGTELEPANAGDSVFTSGDVKVGGTTAAPKTELKADGTAAFAGTAIVGTDGIRFSRAHPDGYIWQRGGNNGNGFIRCEDPSANAKFTVAGDGSASFASGATFSSKYVEIDSSGEVKLQRSAGVNAALSIYQGTAVPIAGTPNIQLNADGSATFDGKLLVGTSTGTGHKLVVQDDGGGMVVARSAAPPSDGSLLGYCGFSSVNQIISASVVARRDSAAWTDGTNQPSALTFQTTPAGTATPVERMRVTSGGDLNAFSSGSDHKFRTTETATTAAALSVRNGATNNVDGTVVFLVRADGDCENTNNSYGAISDIKLKENIVDANSQWDDLKALQVRNYNFKEGQTHTQIGLVAQEAELVSPGLVSESPDRDADGNDLGTVTKSVNYSVLYMKAVKALQEAMARIETLEAKVAALEGA